MGGQKDETSLGLSGLSGEAGFEPFMQTWSAYLPLPYPHLILPPPFSPSDLPPWHVRWWEWGDVMPGRWGCLKGKWGWRVKAPGKWGWGRKSPGLLAPCDLVNTVDALV